MTPHDDPDRDAWLRAALRHAPDAEAGPPPALSETILRQARAATRPASPPPVDPAPGALARFWKWLARPPVAAGFASVTVATLVGVLWLDRPLDETLSPRPDAVAVTAPRSDAPASRGEQDAAKPAATGTAAAPAAPETAAAPVEPGAAAAPVAPGAAAAPAIAQAGTDEQPAAGVAAKPAAPAPRAAKQAAPRSTPKVASPGVTPEPAVSAVPLPAPAPFQPRPGIAAANSFAARGALVDRPGALADAIVSITADPTPWTYRRSGAPRPVTPALQAWLARLDAATAGHWHAGGPAVAAVGTPTLRLYRDGAPALSLRLSDGAASAGPQLRAELAPDRLAELLADLDTAAP